MSRSSDASKPWSANSSAGVWFAGRLLPALKAFGDAPAMLAVRESLPWSFLGLLGGLLVFLALVPVAPGPVGRVLLERFAQAELPAFGVMAATLVVVLAYRLAGALGLSRAALAAAASTAFVLSLPRPYAFARPLAYLHLVGESGLFLAILVCLLGAFAMCRARAFLGRTGPADAAGAALVVLVALALFFAHVSAGGALLALVRPLGALGDTYGALLALVVIETLLWLIGIHGPATLAAIVTPVYLALQAQNTAAYVQHAPLPHIVTVSLFLFVFPGGAGATLPLCALLCFSRVARLRKIARLTIVPAIFNINEPLLFGLPVVFNPFLAVPFVIAPVLLATTTYLAIAHGAVARPWTYVPAGVPTLVSTYVATLDPRAVVLASANIALATLVYLPFVRAYERHEERAAA